VSVALLGVHARLTWIFDTATNDVFCARMRELMREAEEDHAKRTEISD
jgi:hypothetical protein